MIYDKFEKLNDGKHDRAIKALIGISRSKFDKLAVAFLTLPSNRNGASRA